MIGPAGRRIVTGLDADGKSCVLFEGPAPITIWQTDSTPADNSGTVDTGYDGFDIAVAPGGTKCIAFAYEPRSDMGAIGMHATNTIDYVIILSGNVTMITETGETLLGAGDVVVDRGIIHGWRNDGDAPCQAVCVMVDAHPVGAGATV